VSYGREPSKWGTLVNHKIGREIFHSGREEAVVSSAEVSQ